MKSIQQSFFSWGVVYCLQGGKDFFAVKSCFYKGICVILCKHVVYIVLLMS